MGAQVSCCECEEEANLICVNVTGERVLPAGRAAGHESLSEQTYFEIPAEDTIEGSFYLPTKLQGIAILRNQGFNSFVADNTFLNDDTPGIAYRLSKNLKDVHPLLLLPWGMSITGLDETDGWIRIDDGQERLE